MKCKLCGSNEVLVAYNDVIRNGGLGRFTQQPVAMYQCKSCGVIWHEPVLDNISQYYESDEYRNSMIEGTDEQTFYLNHDAQTLEKFTYTGTDIYRSKIVADIGCGAGAFLDFVKGVASNVIAVEPTAEFRRIMDRKGFHTYAYAKDAYDQWRGKVDVVTSFDVIEHVENPQAFLDDAYGLLKRGG